MARVLPVEVAQIYTITDANKLAPFIEVADLLVTEELSGQGLSDDRLKQITLYLSAHFAIITFEKGGLIKQKIGDAEEQYQNVGTRNVTVGLAATRFGQQAILLDTSGTLGALSQKPVKAQFRVVEQPAC